ncbi:MAG TPA: SOS response-associated peptidase [Thermoanaerobaculia bacterium]|nr:SOS response-associated peptidase [Thermoanaerobaculia bacterium]
MCGRYTLATPGDVIAQQFELAATPSLAPRYNVAPTQEVPAVRAAKGGGRELAMMKWGLVPRWAEDPSIGNRLINARSETAAEKPSFRSAFKRQRCLVLADGFYEWQKAAGGVKQPFHIRLAGGGPFAFAGLWEHWQKEGQTVESCTLLTTGPNPLMAPIHDRMPVILDPTEYDLWLDPGQSDRARLEALLDPFPAERMEAWPVSRFVNSPTNDSPRCIEPVSSA